MADLVYEDTPLYDLWLKLMLGGILAVLFTIGVVLLFDDVQGAAAMFGATFIDALIFKAVMPQRFQVFADSLRVALGGPFALTVPFSTIREAREAPKSKAFAYWGLRFATSTRNLVEIARNKGWNLIIAPLHRDMFLAHLNQALDAARASSSD